MLLREHICTKVEPVILSMNLHDCSCTGYEKRVENGTCASFVTSSGGASP
jgi:hypothetical protein